MSVMELDYVAKLVLVQLDFSIVEAALLKYLILVLSCFISLGLSDTHRWKSGCTL